MYVCVDTAMHVFTCEYVYIHMCTCVCVCVFVYLHLLSSHHLRYLSYQSHLAG